MAKRRSK
jgi:hypothetical protein